MAAAWRPSARRRHEASTPTASRRSVDLDLDVADGEFMVLVGPSGCGKTTALRMVAGLEDITDGTIEIGGRVVNDLSPRDRDIAMVFQNYALYPHMTVAENIGFSLQPAEAAEGRDARARSRRPPAMLGLTEHLDRKPAQLSGGQRQRVAMGRAIVREPAAFLMDEPLSNLDAKLRVHMRAEVSRIQRRLGVATLYVTHDQVEAMTMGDRVAVMRTRPAAAVRAAAGALRLARRTCSSRRSSARRAMNLYQGDDRRRRARSSRLGDQSARRSRRRCATSASSAATAAARSSSGSAPRSSATRRARRRRRQPAALEGTVDLVEELGAEKLVHFHIDAARLSATDALLAERRTRSPRRSRPARSAAATATAGVARIAPDSHDRRRSARRLHASTPTACTCSTPRPASACAALTKGT